MAARRPKRVRIVEVGPRDGLQNEAAAIPTNIKVGFVDLLSEAGFAWIEVTSFVHPRAVPQMADADEVFRAIGKMPGVRYVQAPASSRPSGSRSFRGVHRRRRERPVRRGLLGLRLREAQAPADL